MRHLFSWLGFGVVLAPDHPLPWAAYGDLENWWVSEVCGFRPTTPLYTKAGDLVRADTSDEDMDRYVEEEERYMSTQPQLLLDCVPCGTEERPQYALLLMNTLLSATPGQPIRVNASDLRVKKGSVETIMNFCTRFGLPVENEPCWLLITDADALWRKKKGTPDV